MVGLCWRLALLVLVMASAVSNFSASEIVKSSGSASEMSPVKSCWAEVVVIGSTGVAGSSSGSTSMSRRLPGWPFELVEGTTGVVDWLLVRVLLQIKQ